ncbi:MAG: PEP/pyruvate-binding domain-containing protein, partial [Anaerolineales bacterium]
MKLRFCRRFQSDNPEHSHSIRLVPLNRLKHTQNIGQKAALFHWLTDHTSHVPHSYILTTDVHEKYLCNPEDVIEKVSISIKESLDLSKEYVVRSSSTLEDQARTSYAGQFKSLIHLKGADEIADAVREVFDSAGASNVDSYREHMADIGQDLGMAVLIQEMVAPVMSGVAVSRNPLTGLNEIMVEAVRGSGEALVQDGQTPDHWVYKWGRFIQTPRHPILPDEWVEQIVQETQKLGNAFGSPVDLEWVFDGQDIYWVQVRPLTGLDTINIYSNTISREMLPGLIKPLIWSVNVPLVNSAWINLFEELVGPTDLKPEKLAKSFYYHAYFNMGVIGQIFELLGFPRDSLELLMGFEKAEGMPTYKPSFKTLRILPRVVRFLLRLAGYRTRLDHDYEAIKRAYREFDALNLRSLSEQELLEVYDKLYAVNLQLAYHNILVPLSM